MIDTAVLVRMMNGFISVLMCVCVCIFSASSSGKIARTVSDQAKNRVGICCSIARHKNDPTAKYCQLATAAVGGGASCRTWVFRGFYEDKGALKFITDRRSQKIPEIEADPGALTGELF